MHHTPGETQKATELSVPDYWTTQSIVRPDYRDCTVTEQYLEGHYKSELN